MARDAFVTPVANRSRSVAAAATATATNGSPMRFCESVNVMPSHPEARGPSASPTAVPAPAPASSTTPMGYQTTIEPTRDFGLRLRAKLSAA